MNYVITKSIIFFKEEDGITAIEYALIASLICLAILISLSTLGNAVSSLYNAFTGKIVNTLSGS
jgi:pilus assembly protein Flp/PilA